MILPRSFKKLVQSKVKKSYILRAHLKSGVKQKYTRAINRWIGTKYFHFTAKRESSNGIALLCVHHDLNMNFDEVIEDYLQSLINFN